MFTVFLDTNIYRSLGLRFAKQRDYEFLFKFLQMSGHDLGIIGVVKQELLDYYEKDVFGKAVTEYQRVVKQFEDNPFLKKLPMPDFDEILKEAMRLLELDLNVFLDVDVSQIPSELMTQFLLFNKSESRRDNARDFLIFYNLIEVCDEDTDRTVVLISQDKIFRQNSFFAEELRKRKIKNLQVFESIAAFLAEVGQKVEWLTKDMVIGQVNKNIIEEELRNDVTCLPSYISDYYYEKDGDDIPNLKKLHIQSINVEDYYVYRMEEKGQLILNVDLRVKVFAVFGPDPYPEQLKSFLTTRPVPTINRPETFDEKGNLIYNEDILFLFSGEINDAKKTIENFHFTDFMPSYFRYENWVPGLAYELIPIDSEGVEQIKGQLPNSFM